jgi:murein DD-endopeptidase MepM/ murein hydrolase activator NlpD
MGVHLIIDHVIDGEEVSSVYGHMAFGSLSLQVGDVVKRGQIVGLVGSTGMSTGPHLHLGILKDGEPIEPLAWMRAHVNS